MSMEQEQVVRVLMRERVKLCAYIWTFLRDDHLCEDVFQDVSVAVLAHLEELEDEVHLLRWLRQAARFRAIDAMRRRRNEPLLFDDDVQQLLDADWANFDPIESAELVTALRSCVEKLSPYARKLIELRYSAGLSGAQIANMVNRNLNTVYVALTRIYRGLGDCIRHRTRMAEGAIDG
jgi:RNA polymerase sigma-70 factor (ECF subfamily)